MKARIISVLLVLSLICTLFASCGKNSDSDKRIDDNSEEITAQPVYDKEASAVTKTETVYVNLESDGSITQINVSDWLHTDESEVYVDDVSDLKDITNLKSNILPVTDGNNVRWNMSETDLYYGGKSDRKLPISFDISYKLNGKTLSPEKIAGKEGNVEIIIKVNNEEYKDVKVEGKNHRVYLPLIVAGGMILPEGDFSAVEVENGQAIGDGTKEICFFVGMPGFSESLGISNDDLNDLGGLSIGDTFVIKAETKSFSLGNMYFAALPIGSLNFDIMIPDNLDDLKSTFAALKAFENTLNSVDPNKVLLGLLSDEKKVGEIMDAMTSAMTLYTENKELLAVLGKYATQENLDSIKDLMDTLSDPDIQSALETLSDPKVQIFFKKLPELSDEFESVSPILSNLQKDLQDPVVAAQVEKLPETLEAIKKITKVINDNSDSLDIISSLLNEDGTEVIESLIKNLDLSSLSILGSKYGDLAKDGDLLISLAEQWLSFGKSYGLYTKSTENMSTSLAFVFNTPSIQAKSTQNDTEPVTQSLPWYKKIFK